MVVREMIYNVVKRRRGRQAEQRKDPSDQPKACADGAQLLLVL